MTVTFTWLWSPRKPEREHQWINQQGQEFRLQDVGFSCGMIGIPPYKWSEIREIFFSWHCIENFALLVFSSKKRTQWQQMHPSARTGPQSFLFKPPFSRRYSNRRRNRWSPHLHVAFVVSHYIAKPECLWVIAWSADQTQKKRWYSVTWKIRVWKKGAERLGAP